MSDSGTYNFQKSIFLKVFPINIFIVETSWNTLSAFNYAVLFVLCIPKRLRSYFSFLPFFELTWKYYLRLLHLSKQIHHLRYRDFCRKKGETENCRIARLVLTLVKVDPIELPTWINNFSAGNSHQLRVVLSNFMMTAHLGVI